MGKFDLEKYWDFRVWVKSQIAQLRALISEYQQNGGGGGTGGGGDFDPNGSYPNVTVGNATKAKSSDLATTALELSTAPIISKSGNSITISVGGKTSVAIPFKTINGEGTIGTGDIEVGGNFDPDGTYSNLTVGKAASAEKYIRADGTSASISESIDALQSQYVSLDNVLEIGNIYFNGSNIVYQDSPKRARIMRGVLLPLKAGDKIVSTSENIRFFAGTKTFSNAGWKNGIVEYIIPRDDNWSIVMTDYPTEQNTTLSNYEGKIFIKTENHIYLTEYLARIVELQYQTNFDTNIKAVNHRGWYDAPENTLVAYRESRKQGFNYVECDVSFTKDGIPVLLHDSTIDRTSNGSGSIANMTFEEVSAFDFGSWKSEKYAGEKIPKLRDFIMLCKKIGLHPYIELKDGSEARIKDVVQVVNSCGMRGKVTYISFTASLLEYVVQTDENARVGLVCNSVTENTIQLAGYLQTGKNEVFIDSGTATYEEMMLCLNNGYPLEVWTYNNLSNVQSLGGYEYISGVTSDRMIIGKEMLNTSIND